MVYYPIPTPRFVEILNNPNMCAFKLDHVDSYSGQLLFNTSAEAVLGVGGFKTAHSAQLILSPLASSGLGLLPRHMVVLKQPYYRVDADGDANATQEKHSASKKESKFKCYVLAQELLKLFREANVLYWAKSLMQVTYKFIDHCIQNTVDVPLIEIPRLCFVEAGLALAHSHIGKGGAGTTTGAYLLEELIECESGGFTKFIHNVDCSPLLEPGDDGYEITEFLVFTQHVQYMKTKGQAYISDYQGE